MNLARSYPGLSRPPEDPLPADVARDWYEEFAGLPREFTNSLRMRFVLIPAGTFRMGSTDAERQDLLKLHSDEADWLTVEGPQHEVQITRPLYLAVTPVTQEQYERVMGINPSWYSAKGVCKDQVRGMDTRLFPVENVSWEDAVEVARQLSAFSKEAKSGRTYRLPTEAEWEYACRGGAASYQIFHFGSSLSSTQANFDGRYPYGGAHKGARLQRTCKVASYPANGFGLYDMHGNVQDWCSDWHNASYYAVSPRQDPQGPAKGSARVLRGGCFRDEGWYCRSAHRNWDAPAEKTQCDGFRLVAVPSLEQS
jgi:formylglycine-generating enzyme required for sulfatase activity